MRSSPQRRTTHLYVCVVPADGEARICTNRELTSPMWPAGAGPLWRPGTGSVAARRPAAEDRDELLRAPIPALRARRRLLPELVVIAHGHAQLEPLPAVLALELVESHRSDLLLDITETPPYNLGGPSTSTAIAQSANRPSATVAIGWRDWAPVYCGLACEASFL